MKLTRMSVIYSAYVYITLFFCTATRADLSKAQLSAEVVSAVQSTLLANGGSSSTGLIAQSQAYANEAGQTGMLIRQQHIDDRVAAWIIASFVKPMQHSPGLFIGKEYSDASKNPLVLQATVRLSTLTADKGKKLLALREAVLPGVAPFFAAAERQILSVLASQKHIIILCGVETITGFSTSSTAKVLGLLGPAERPTYGGPTIDVTNDQVTSDLLASALAYQIHEEAQEADDSDYNAAFGSMSDPGYDDGDPLHMASLKSFEECRAQASAIMAHYVYAAAGTSTVDVYG